MSFVVTVPSHMQYLTIPNASRLLSEAFYPALEGELPIDQALKHQNEGGVHFSEVLETTPQNVVLRRKSTAVFHEAGLHTAAREGRITLLSPMTYGPIAIPMQGNPHWQQQVNRCLIHLSDLARYAESFHIQVVSEPEETFPVVPNISTTDETQSRKKISTARQNQLDRTARRHQYWVEQAIFLKERHPEWSTKRVAEQIETITKGSEEYCANWNTIRAAIRNKY